MELDAQGADNTVNEAPRALLLTGASGFVGSRLLGRFVAGELPALEGVHVHALSRTQPRHWPVRGVSFHAIDLADREALGRLLIGLQPAPTWVLHLAGMADPRAAARVPRQAKAANAEVTRNLLEALADRGLPTRFLLASTAAVYGKHAVPGENDEGGRIPEGSVARSRTAYGWSKRLAERATLACTAPGLERLVARPYNHAGPGQGLGYVVPDLAHELRRALAESRPARTGSLWPERDLLHVDEVIDAYLLLLQRGTPGRIYDIARGEAIPMQAIFDGLVQRLGAPLGHEVDEAKTRVGELRRIIGDPASLLALGWRPKRDLDAILDDALVAPD